MIETMCRYPGRDELVIAYLYDDIDPAEQTAFASHVAACARCRRELAELRGVRSTLSAWAPPEPMRVTSHEPLTASDGQRATSSWWRDIPAWAQVAAALLVLGVSARVANVDVRHDRSGWTVRTGWWTTPAPLASSTSSTSSTGAIASPTSALTPASSASISTGASAPWEADLAALEQQLRAEMRAVAPSSRAVPSTSVLSDAVLALRVRPILNESERRQKRDIDESERRQMRDVGLRLTELEKKFNAKSRSDLVESERRQQSELALRVGQLEKDVNARRNADLAKIDLAFAANQTSEAVRQRQLVNYLVQQQLVNYTRVSQK